MNETASRLWYERPAKDITPGDFIMLREGKAWTPKIVRRVEHEGDKIALSWWIEKHEVEQEFEPDELLEML